LEREGGEEREKGTEERERGRSGQEEDELQKWVGLLIIERAGERSDLSLDFRSLELDCYSHCLRQKERNTKRNKERKKGKKGTYAGRK